MSGPVAKRAKLSSEGILHHYYTDGNTPHDRTLLVDSTYFYVQSKTLIEQSDYFRPMFTSVFVEKAQDVVEIKVFDAQKMEMFLNALYKPKEFVINSDNVITITELFVYFQAVPFLTKLYRKKKVFDNVAANMLLHLFNRFGLTDLKDELDAALVDKMKQKLNKYQETSQRIYDEWISIALKLCSQFTLPKLKNLVDEQLAVDYRENCNSSHVENRYIALIQKHQLLHLKDEIERSLLDEFENDLYLDLQRCKKYLETSSLYGMSKLTDKVEEYLLSRVESLEYLSISKYREYLTTSTTNGLNKLTEAIEDYLMKNGFKYVAYVYREALRTYLEELNHNDATVAGCSDDAEHNDDKFAVIVQLSGVLEDVDKYGLKRLKDYIENESDNACQVNNESVSTFAKMLRIHKKPVLKNFVEKHLTALFEAGEFDVEFIKESCAISSKYKMEQLTAKLDTYLVADFKATRNFEYIKYAFTDKSKLLCSSESTSETKDSAQFTMFEDAVKVFLTRSHTNDPIIRAARRYIADMSPKAQQCFFKYLKKVKKFDDDE